MVSLPKNVLSSSCFQSPHLIFGNIFGMSLFYSEIKIFAVPGAISHNSSSNDFQFTLSKGKDLTV